MKIIKTLIVTLMLFISTLAAAEDCIFIPGKTLCGVSIKSSSEQFINTLGEPDGKINMGPARVGLVYGPKLLLIFSSNKLYEVHSWETNSNIDFWEYVRNSKSATSKRLIFNNWSPWGMSRKQMELHEKEFPLVDADQFVEHRKAEKANMTIFYSPFYNPQNPPITDLNEWALYKVQHISIRFGR